MGHRLPCATSPPNASPPPRTGGGADPDEESILPLLRELAVSCLTGSIMPLPDALCRCCIFCSASSPSASSSSPSGSNWNCFCLNMLFKIPIWCGVLITGLSTLMLLFLQQYGVRKLEILIAFLIFLIATCFLVELGYCKTNSSEVVRGLFVPEIKGNGATGLAISLLGAMVMPNAGTIFFFTQHWYYEETYHNQFM